MLPERYFQKEFGISINTVDALRNTVKSTIESANESVITYGYHHFFSMKDPARITGRTGRTQGARIVRIPAMNEMNTSENIILELRINFPGFIFLISYTQKELR